MGEGNGVDTIGRLEEFEAEVRRLGRQLRQAMRSFETYRLEQKVKQRRLMVRIVGASSEPMTPAEIHQELVRDGFPFLSEDGVHQEASVYQACRDLEEIGEFKRSAGRKLAYQVVPGAVGKQQAWERFVNAWWDTYRSKPVRVCDLIRLALKVDRRLVEGQDEHARRVCFGMQLAKRKGELFGQVKLLQSGTGDPHWLWFLERQHRSGKLGPEKRT